MFSIDCRVVIVSGNSATGRTTLLRGACPFVRTMHDRRGLKFTKNGGLNVGLTGKGCLFLLGGSIYVIGSTVPLLVGHLLSSSGVTNISPLVQSCTRPRTVRFTKCARLSPVALEGEIVNGKGVGGSRCPTRGAPCLRNTTVLLGGAVVSGLDLVPRRCFLCCRRLS